MGLVDDWVIYRDNTEMTALIHLGSGIIAGTGTLELRELTTGAWNQIHLIRATSPSAFVSGRCRWLTARSGGSLGDVWGFQFCQSQADLTGGSGLSYLATLHQPGATRNVRLYRCSAGLNTKTLLVDAPAFTMPDGDIVAMEVQWLLDVQNLGGMHIRIRNSDPYDTLPVGWTWEEILINTPVSYLDLSGYLTSSVGEGPVFISAGIAGRYYFDTMECIPYLVGAITN